MADNSLNPRNWLGFTFGDGSGGTFAPMTGSASPIPAPSPSPASFSDRFTGAPASGPDTIGTETTKRTTVGTETTTTTETTTSNVNQSFLGSWLTRIAVILLGFIFVAVGLTMFRTNQSVLQVVKVKK
jgi:hypothetical protein